MPALRTLLGCLLILAVARLTAADAPPDKDKEKKDEPPAEKIVTTGQAVGVLQNWNESEGKFTLHVKIKYSEANQQVQNDYMRELQNFQNRQVQIMQNRDPRARQNELNRLYQDMANFQNRQWNFYSIKEKEQNIDVELIDDAKVRLNSPPAVFDEKGNVKQYTPAELKELKGNDNLPGYPGERDNLRNGQTVLVTFGYKQAVKKPDAEKKEPEKKEPEKKDPEKKEPEKKAPPPPRPKVVQVLIVSEPKG
jgi:hypothetical protein